MSDFDDGGGLDVWATDIILLGNRTRHQVPMAAAVSPFVGPTTFMIVKQDKVNEWTWDGLQGWSLPEICYVARVKVLWEETYGFLSLSKKTRKSNHLQMSEQSQHFLLSYFKTHPIPPGISNPFSETENLTHMSSAWIYLELEFYFSLVSSLFTIYCDNSSQFHC